jgi:hypothetical protein
VLLGVHNLLAAVFDFMNLVSLILNSTGRIGDMCMRASSTLSKALKKKYPYLPMKILNHSFLSYPIFFASQTFANQLFVNHWSDKLLSAQRKQITRDNEIRVRLRAGRLPQQPVRSSTPKHPVQEHLSPSLQHRLPSTYYHKHKTIHPDLPVCS